ncbi:MAG: serpin family protein [Gemmataceae bacterium]|nr:serpin family protein [Gemmataceae bacterium]MCI0740608.1 serpin family protein [Gemmataceae bacterium]
MKSYTIAMVQLALVFGAFSFSCCQEKTGPDPKPDLQTLVQGNNEFAFDLYRRLAQKEKGNVIFSPYSISIALAMTYAGARGETAKEMAKVLHFSLGQEGTHPAFAALNQSLQPPSEKPLPFQLNIANALWGQERYGFREQFLTLSRKYYGAGLRELDFTNAEEARRIINDWVEKQTNKKIKELLARGVISSATRLVLTNAVYFKATWKYQFSKQGTRNAPFQTALGNTISVPMMFVGYCPFRYYAGPNFQLVELPYEGERFSMLVLLPQKGITLAKIEQSLTASTIDHAVSKLLLRSGKVELPRFTMDSPFQLGTELSAMGMPTAFSPTADFSGMVSGGGLVISDVIHKAYIKVDESGTEAAAATAVIMFGGSSPRFSFTADRPFLFLIRDNHTGSTLFLGRIVEPKKVS